MTTMMMSSGGVVQPRGMRTSLRASPIGHPASATCAFTAFS